MKNVLVLGISGMLGSMVYHYFCRNNNIVTAGTYRNFKKSYFFSNDKQISNFNAQNNVKSQLHEIIEHYKTEYIINCIGIIKPYCKDNDSQGIFSAIKINALFPHLLSRAISNIDENIKIIQIATDCVYSGQKGMYNEDSEHDAHDVYGKTKSLGEVKASNFLNIRCSIIGPEIKGKLGLLEWFLSNPHKSQLKGFSHHKWNGITTLQFAQFCEDLIINDKFTKLLKKNHVLHYVPNESVNKFQLLNIFKEVYRKDYEIEEINNIGYPVDRTLYSKYLNNSCISIKKSIDEMRNYSISSGIF